MKYKRIDGATKLSSFIKPMLAQLTDQPAFDDPEWIFEIKWDGYRAIAEIHDHNIRLYSRNGLSFAKAYPKVFETLKTIGHNVVLDGEIVVFNKAHKPDFQKLQNYDNNKSFPLHYYVFDCLALDGEDMTKLPLLERKEILRGLLPENDVIRYCDHVVKTGIAFFQQIVKQELEGMIAKKATSLYLPGKRTTSWLKIKNVQGEEAIITGFTRPKGSRKGFGSLLLAQYKQNKLTYIGNVGTGFTDNVLTELFTLLKKQTRKDSPLDIPVKPPPDTTWVEPVYVCNVRFTEKTAEGIIRHPVFAGLRVDKTPREVKPEKATLTKNTNTTNDERTIKVDRHTLILRNLDTVYWPTEKITKADVIAYYNTVARYMLPHLKDRPQTLFRTPGGARDDGFYHKNAGDIAASFVATVKIPSTTYGEDRHYILCNNRATLLFLNNLGCIEINPWLSRVKKPDHPDYVVLDLDPGEKNTFDDVIETALCIKAILDKAGATAYCKTSGSTGLHIYIPVKARYEYEPVRAFGNLIALLANQQLPNLTTLVRGLDKRKKDNIYIDYLQNKRAATLAAVYSIRPVAGAQVSMPLQWKEVKPGLTPAQFNITNAVHRIQKKGDLFLPVLREHNNLHKCLKNLGV